MVAPQFERCHPLLGEGKMETSHSDPVPVAARKDGRIQRVTEGMPSVFADWRPAMVILARSGRPTILTYTREVVHWRGLPRRGTSRVQISTHVTRITLHGRDEGLAH